MFDRRYSTKNNPRSGITCVVKHPMQWYKNSIEKKFFSATPNICCIPCNNIWGGRQKLEETIFIWASEQKSAYNLLWEGENIKKDSRAGPCLTKLNEARVLQPDRVFNQTRRDLIFFGLSFVSYIIRFYINILALKKWNLQFLYVYFFLSRSVGTYISPTLVCIHLARCRHN